MENLNWDAFFAQPAVERAYRDLELLTSRPVLLHSLSLVPGAANPFWCASRDAIHVFIDEPSPTCSHAIVHELIHGILMEEGYTRLTGDQLRRFLAVRDTLSNEFQHPEVFRRMEAYGLDMLPYWELWDAKLRTWVDGARWDFTDPHAGFRHFPQVFSWFFFPVVSAPHLKEYSKLEPKLYHATAAAHEAAATIGFSTPQAYLRLLGVFKMHWLRFCIENLPNDDRGIKLIQAISDSVTKPVREIADSRNEYDIIAELKNFGLR